MSEFEALSGHDIHISPFMVSPVELEIVSKINDHAWMYFKAVVPENRKEEYIHMVQGYTIIEVNHKNEASGTTCLFKGVVTFIDVKAVNDVYYLEVKAASCTFDMDVKLKRRSFQNKEMLYNELIKSVTDGYKGADFIDKTTDNKKLEKFIIQYDETDWEFLKRMASHFNAGLLPDPTADKPKFFFGIPKRDGKGDMREFNYSVHKKIGDFRYSSENFIEGIDENDFIFYKIETDKLLNIGDLVSFQNKKLYVYESEGIMTKGEFKHEYTLSPEKGLSQNHLFHERVVGASIEGKVIDIKEDNVRVHLEIDREQKKEEAYWFPYSTFYTTEGQTGWYCMPELDDRVKLYFPTNKEEDGIVTGSVRRRTKGGDFITDPDMKIFRTRFGKEIMFNKNEILISGKDGEILIRLLEDYGIEIYSKKDVRIIADKDILMHAGRTVQIMAADGIGLKCKESSIEMDGEIVIQGKEVKIN